MDPNTIASPYEKIVHDGRNREAEWDGRSTSSGTRGVPIWAIAGLAGAALVGWALYSFGPDLRRYLKIETM